MILLRQPRVSLADSLYPGLQIFHSSGVSNWPAASCRSAKRNEDGVGALKKKEIFRRRHFVSRSHGLNGCQASGLDLVFSSRFISARINTINIMPTNPQVFAMSIATPLR